MWWLFLDPEDAGPVLVVSIFLVVCIFLGIWIWGPKDVGKVHYKVHYDTVQNDSVIILKKKGHVVYDTIGKTDSTLVLKKRMVYN
jgi:hypothetical protein